MSKTSLIWNYFKDDPDDKDKAICQVGKCKESLIPTKISKKNYSTSSLNNNEYIF